MKSLFSVLFILAFFACGEDEMPDVLIIEFNETVTSADLSITFSGIQDSRCPREVECVWEGEAKVELLVEQNSLKEVVELTERGLCEGDCGSMAIAFDRVFHLLEVTPYPVDGVPFNEDDYEISVRVSDR